jgi:hypothetical protein
MARRGHAPGPISFEPGSTAGSYPGLDTEIEDNLANEI